jgi:class 3 adenylate cyclase/tetratricopeptide (TPR) repeat protein
VTKARQGRTASVLFTDLVGSTELLSRLGEAAFDELRRTHFTALQEAIGRCGGEQVKSLGDGVLAIFGSAADALRCAVAMQQAVDRQARTGPASLGIRVGLSLGDVSVEDGDVFGTPVVEAARLVAAAQGGQILASAVVRAVAGGRSEACFTDLGCLELKGLPAPVAVCEVVWEPLLAPAAPLPALLTGMGRIFVGRDGQLAQLHQLWEEARAGELRVALVGGEPGVGKTRLAAELAARAHGEGATVLAGRCDEDLGVPYQPFVEALRHLVDHTPPQELGSRLGRYGGELARLVPELRERVPDLPPALRSDPETERYRLFDAVASWLGATSQEQPILVVLDDLHWAAKPTLLLLRHVLRWAQPMRVLVVATYRDTELGRTHPLSELIADLRRQNEVVRFSLTGLDASEVVLFLEQAAGHELGPERDELARAIHRETEGNAFFVREVVRHLIETGSLREEAGRWMTGRPVEELGIPEGVRDVIGRRLARLPEATNRVLAVAAVVGQEFELAVLQAAGNLDEEAILAALDEAVAARVVIEVRGPASGYRFAHALVRSTIYEELSGARRTVVHRRVAEAIERVHATRLDDHLPALARHYIRASARTAGSAKAVDYARKAGDRALLHLAHDEAITFYSQALEVLELTEQDPTERVEVLISLGEAQRRAGVAAYRETLSRAARLALEVGHADASARATLANNRGNYAYSTLGLVDRDRVAELEHALEAVGHDSPIRALLLGRLGVELVFDLERSRRLRLSDDALAMARRLGDRRVLAQVLLSRFFTLGGPDTLVERIANTAELEMLAEELRDPAMAGQAATLGYRGAMERGDIEAAVRYQRHSLQVGVEFRQPFLRFLAAHHDVGPPLLAGDLDRAEAAVSTALAIGESLGDPDAHPFWAIQRFWLSYERGTGMAELEPALCNAFARCSDLPLLRTTLGRLACELGRAQDHSAVKAVVNDTLPVNHHWSMNVTNAAALASLLGDTSWAAVLYKLLLPYRTQMAFAMGLSSGSVAHYLGMLGATLRRDDDAEAHFSDAQATHTRIGARPWLARTRLEWARMLLTRRDPGDVERAKELLGQALTTARELGLGNVERRAVALLTQFA